MPYSQQLFVRLEVVHERLVDAASFALRHEASDESIVRAYLDCLAVLAIIGNVIEADQRLKECDCIGSPFLTRPNGKRCHTHKGNP